MQAEEIIESREEIIKFALVAIGEARVAARAKTGDASNANPTTLQQGRIAAASGLADPESDTRRIAKSITLPGVILHRVDGDASAVEVLAEIRRAF